MKHPCPHCAAPDTDYLGQRWDALHGCDVHEYLCTVCGERHARLAIAPTLFPEGSE